MSTQPYTIRTDVKFAPLQLIDVDALAAQTKEPWFNQTLCQVNDSVVRVGVLQGEFHWHKHDREDEFFYVVEGRFLIDLEGRTVELAPRQGFTVPRGVLHRTRAPVRSVILMFESAGVVPTGDA
ncbi:MAG TPA: cupin domain-containing protein [Burkholderiales bacterium]|nr:cupin domain-containing protein [Burkholderiales bacterium]